MKRISYCVPTGQVSRGGGEHVGSRVTLADALHQAGEIEEARGLFKEAERMQQERQPEYRYLYSLQGYRYCDLLLARISHSYGRKKLLALV